MSAGVLHNWGWQDQIDRCECSGTTTYESAELTKANRRIRELEVEVENLRKAAKLLGDGLPRPKGCIR